MANLTGVTRDCRIKTVDVLAPSPHVANRAFDVTRAKYVTERGVVKADKTVIAKVFPERAS